MPGRFSVPKKNIIIDNLTKQRMHIKGGAFQSLFSELKGDPDLKAAIREAAGSPTTRMAGDKIKQTPMTQTRTTPQQTVADFGATEPRRIITRSPGGVHTMGGMLTVESALANDPGLQRAMINRYGGDQFSSNDLVRFEGEGAMLQRQGVDFITPSQQLVDLKLRQPNVTYDDLLIELMSVDKQRQLGRGYKPSNADELVNYLSKIQSPNAPGWTIDPKKRTDEIVYYMPGRKEISFINAPALRNAVPELLDRQFAAKRGRPFYSVAPNRTYNTVNMPIDNRIVRSVLGSDIETIRV